MPARDYITVSFPQDIIDEVKDIINSDYLKGYRTYTEFCVDSVRHRLEDIKKEMKEERFPRPRKKEASKPLDPAISGYIGHMEDVQSKDDFKKIIPKELEKK